MQAHRMHVVVPEDRQTTIEFPETIRSGPVELIVLVPSEAQTAGRPEDHPQARGRIKALAAELARDGRPFRELSAEERGARLEQVMGVGQGLMSTSEELARQKRQEVDLEDRAFGR